MRYRKLGKTGLDVSAIGFGCNQIGSDRMGYRNFESVKDAVYLAIEKGINYFDTADVYGDRQSEEWLGRILGPKRPNVILSTKAGLTGDGGRNGHPDHLRKSLENSLKKLKTDYVDIFYLHRPDPKIPLAESISAIDKLIQEGKTRFGGVSQLDKEYLETIKTSNAISCVQYCLNFFNFRAAYSIKSIVNDMQYGFSTFSPMASGWILKKKYLSLTKSQFPFLKPNYYRPEFPLYKRIVELAQEYKTNIHQLAVNWILSHQYVHTVIVGTSSCKQLQENIDAINLPIPLELIELVNNIVKSYSVERYKTRKIIWDIELKLGKLLKG
ncbi:MAG TPA: aldo/keto reductase [Candidatus Wujingus californicus]|uniref:aldo/keto reductase n=1 Tax=Candidatus Wujingus californicus TaxID=3367618 RepID=UPI004026F8C7